MVKVNVGTMSAQASSVSAIVSQRVSALTDAKQSLSSFASQDQLKGAAYQNAKAYATSVLGPLIDGMILLSEETEKGVTKLQTLYAEKCGSESLDSEVLTDKIEKDQELLIKIQDLQAHLDKHASFLSHALDGLEATVKARLRKNKKKLKNLMEFNAESSSVFEALAEFQDSVSTGLSFVSKGFNNFNGTFDASGKGLEWTKTIKSGWETRENLKTEYNAVKVKMELGQPLTDSDINVIMDYGSKHPAEKIPPYLQKEFGLVENSVYTDMFSTLASNSITNISGTGIEYGIQKGGAIVETAGANYVLKKSKEIFDARYSTELANGKIMGKVPGATRAAIKASTEGVENTTKVIGKTMSSNLVKGVASNAGSTIIGVGLDMASGDSAEEAWGKEITTGVVSTAATAGVVATVETALVAFGIVATAEFTLPALAVGAIGVGIGTATSIANDWATDKWPELEKFEDNIGEGVVKTWNASINSLKGIFK